MSPLSVVTSTTITTIIITHGLTNNTMKSEEEIDTQRSKVQENSIHQIYSTY